MSSSTTIVTLYVRPDCHLCDEARSVLERMGAIEVREVDIDSDDALLAAYLERIPVVEIDGRTVSELALDEASVRAALGRPNA